MILTYRYRLLPTKSQHRELEAILEQLCGLRFENGRIRFKGTPGNLRVHLHRPLPESHVLKSCTFSRDVQGWCVAFSLELPAPPPRADGSAVGVDLGISTFAALSDGGFIPNLKAARRFERRLKVAHRSLSRKAPASRGRQKARLKLARCHAAVARARANHLHQASARLARDYNIIAVEKLNLRGLTRSALSKEVHDASWGKFISLLRYKAACAGSQLIEVDPYNTSQECSGCGAIVAKQLRDRNHDCRRCNLAMDRDLNAARNILHRAGVSPGLRNVAGCGMRAGGNLGCSNAEPLPLADTGS